MAHIKKIILLLMLALSIISMASEDDSYFNKYGYPAVFDGYIGNYEDNFTIDKDSLPAIGADQRIKYIILHYTATDDVIGKRALSQGDVSAHYLVTENADEPIFSLVPVNERAWHAGISEFYGRTNINDTSIGIEIVNRGLAAIPNSPPQSVFFRPIGEYLPYTDTEIKKVVYLLKNLIKLYGIDPKFILGHSDVAPNRKFDPGPLFPWETLYKEYGIGAWYDISDKNEFMKTYTDEVFNKLEPIEIKLELLKYGYKIALTNEWDENSKRVVYAFQSHFAPNTLNGIMDKETFSILKALNKKYPTQKTPSLESLLQSLTKPEDAPVTTTTIKDDHVTQDKDPQKETKKIDNKQEIPVKPKVQPKKSKTRPKKK